MASAPRPATNVFVALIVFALSSSLFRCDDAGADVAFSGPEGVDVRISESSLFVENKTGRTIAVFVIEQQTASLIDWAPRADSKSSLRDGITREIPYSEAYNYFTGCTLVVYWWFVGPAFDGHAQALVIRTPA